MIDQSTKEQIRKELAKYVTHSGSQNKARVALGVSIAYISKILKGDYEVISDGMWRKLAKSLGKNVMDQWQHAETKPAIKLTQYFDDAAQHGNVFGVVGHPGTGKTDMMENYVKNNKNVFYVKAESDLPRRLILRMLLQSMGYNMQHGSDNTLIDAIKYRILKMENPLIIIDEMESVKNATMMIIKDLYNALWKRCGIVIIGTYNLKSRIETGNARGYLGYNEIFSRLGGRFIELPFPDEDDAAKVINANGITEPMLVSSIVNNSMGLNGGIDLRRIERLVHAEKQKQLAAEIRSLAEIED